MDVKPGFIANVKTCSPLSMKLLTYQTSNISWTCIKCGMPNFSSSIFDLSTFETSNNYSVLSDSIPNLSPISTSPGHPQAMSSPIQTRTKSARPNQSLLRIVNINFQSVTSKKADLIQLIDSVKPHIIVGTETWINPDISDSEIIPPELNYQIYRNDWADGYGGVMLAITKDIISSEVPELKTDCEIVWAEIDIVGSSKLL